MYTNPDTPKIVGAIIIGALMFLILLGGAKGVAKTAAFPP